MILNEPDATPFDLRFRLFGTYVRVHPLFWIISAVFGWNVTQSRLLSENGFVELAIWVVCAFVSILLHEFGHVWMGRAFGTDGHILLQGMGGLAIGASALHRRGQRILVYAAGPAIQLVLYGLLRLAITQGAFNGAPKAVAFAIGIMLFMNLYWPLLNLLPVFPLDGGQISRELCCEASPAKGLLASLWISLMVAGTLALNALAGEYGKSFIPAIVPGYFRAPTGLWPAIFFAMFAVGSWQAIMAEQQSRRAPEDDDALPWER